MSQPWFEHPVLIPFKNKGSKLMFPFEGKIYEAFLPNIYPYDHFDNFGCMGVLITPIGDEEYITIDWDRSMITVTGQDSGIKFSLEWDRIYPIPL